MKEDSYTNLFNKTSSIEFYNDRYTDGYMEDWPQKKKDRIINIIRALNLPSQGLALDYGCGNGVFTDVIKKALPEWDVYGSDISKIAVENARTRFLQCKFFVADDVSMEKVKFDFIFSHHVLEHVYDIDQSTKEIADMAKNQAVIFHVLPCGNAGSLEHDLCSNRTDGINSQINNRFFYEDPGHLRRLTSEELAKKYELYGFWLATSYFANQYYGALDWITNYDADFIRYLTDTSKGKDQIKNNRITSLRRQLMLLYKAKSTMKFFKGKANVPFLSKLKLLGANWVAGYYQKKVDYEWEHQCHDPKGSEMYICLQRN
ncbi:MAG: class I SAM-dependent methyltransferase [Bacteroidota bacterium]|nr:class I SAM-dependent methyltransferase [Bacteroidota bacterium]